MEKNIERLPQTSIRFKPELLKRAHLARIEAGMSFQGIVEAALEKYLTVNPGDEQPAPRKVVSPSLGKNTIPIPDNLSDNLVNRFRAMVSDLAEIFVLRHPEFIGLSERTIRAYLGQARLESIERDNEQVRHDPRSTTARAKNKIGGTDGPTRTRKIS